MASTEQQARTTELRQSRDDDVGRPTGGARQEWREIGLRLIAKAQRDKASLLASGVAFWALLSLFPALVALVSLYGLVADPEEVANQVDNLTEAAPESVGSMLTDQLESIVASGRGGLGLGLVLGVAVALWAASSGMQYLIHALDVAFDEDETRGWLKVRGLALLLTLGAILFVAVAFGVIAVLPAVLEATGLGGVGRWLAQWAPYALLAMAFVGGLSVVYHVGPDRDRSAWRWISRGALLATALWIVASVGFSFYVTNFGTYNETYGSIGAIVVLMLWLFLTALSVVLGAELDAEIEGEAELKNEGF
jgi:membrane protein